MMPLICQRPALVASVVLAVWTAGVWFLTGEFSPLP